MTSVLTGDIIKSRSITNPDIYLTHLKKALSTLASRSDKWEIYRGDSFQIETPIEKSFKKEMTELGYL